MTAHTLAHRLGQCLHHPYPRYGYAVALTLYTQGRRVEALNEQQIRESLAQAIESGLNRFRMRTLDDPNQRQSLRYDAIPISELRAHPELIGSGGNASTGRFLFPSIITTDRDVSSKSNPFTESEKIIIKLRGKASLNSKEEIKRSISPASGEINNGESDKKNQKATLFEIACAMIATVCHEKAAMYVQTLNKSPDPKSKDAAPYVNTAVYPDLNLDELREFVRMYYQMQMQGLDLLSSKVTTKKEFIRPGIHDGNYPDAPYRASFGSIGLLAAMGYWASRVDMTNRASALAVLDSLKNKHLYVINYKTFLLVHISHYAVEMAKKNELNGILLDFYKGALIYSGMSYGNPILYSPSDSRADDYKERKALFFAYKHYYLTFSRFLQMFNASSFQNFLAVRAEYPSSITILLEAYFMQSEHHSGKISMSVLNSARAIGSWMNSTAFHAANAEIEPKDPERRKALTDDQKKARDKQVRKEKAGKLVQFDSYIMSAKDPSGLIYRINETTGRLSQSDAPPEAEVFMSSVASGEIPLKTAQQLILAYMRVRSKNQPGSADSSSASSLEVTEELLADDDSDLII